MIQAVSVYDQVRMFSMSDGWRFYGSTKGLILLFRRWSVIRATGDTLDVL